MNISNLPHDMDEAELKDTVANYGKVLNLRLLDGPRDAPKRGWVEFGSHREAERAVSELDERWRRISGHVKLYDTFHTEGHSGIGIQLVAT